MRASQIAVSARFSGYVPAAKFFCAQAKRRSRSLIDASFSACHWHEPRTLGQLFFRFFARLNAENLAKASAYSEVRMGTRIWGIRFVVSALLLLCPMAMQARGIIITVINTNDSGPGSLRQALMDAHDGDLINFAMALNGQIITLTSA